MKNLKRKLLGIKALLLFTAAFVWANPAEQQLQVANETYRAGNFEESTKQYEALLEQGYRSEALYYNLANSYFRLGRQGRAVLNYERALMLDPTDADTQHNLRVLRSRLPDDIEVLPEFFLEKWWRNISLSLSAESWGTFALVCLWLGVGGLILWLLGKKRQLKKNGFAAGVILLVFSGLAFVLANYHHQLDQNSGRGVVMQSRAAMHSAPDDESQVIRELHEGATILIVDKIGDWYKIALLNGEEGWLPKDTFEKI